MIEQIVENRINRFKPRNPNVAMMIASIWIQNLPSTQNLPKSIEKWEKWRWMRPTTTALSITLRTGLSPAVPSQTPSPLSHPSRLPPQTTNPTTESSPPPPIIPPSHHCFCSLRFLTAILAKSPVRCLILPSYFYFRLFCSS